MRDKPALLKYRDLLRVHSAALSSFATCARYTPARHSGGHTRVVQGRGVAAAAARPYPHTPRAPTTRLPSTLARPGLHLYLYLGEGTTTNLISASASDHAARQETTRP